MISQNTDISKIKTSGSCSCFMITCFCILLHVGMKKWCSQIFTEDFGWIFLWCMEYLYRFCSSFPRDIYKYSHLFRYLTLLSAILIWKKNLLVILTSLLRQHLPFSSECETKWFQGCFSQTFFQFVFTTADC